MLAKPMTERIIHEWPRNIIERVAEKATIMATIEKKMMERSIIIFLAKNSKK